MGTDPTLLESRSSPSPTGVRSIGGFARLVGFSSGIAHSSPDQFLTCSDIPAWRRFISHPRATDRHISLVTEIFSDSNEIRVVKCLREDDAQFFIDVIDEVPPSFLSGILRLTSTQTFALD